MTDPSHAVPQAQADPGSISPENHLGGLAVIQETTSGLKS
jgi:hypothetical protein